VIAWSEVHFQISGLAGPGCQVWVSSTLLEPGHIAWSSRALDHWNLLNTGHEHVCSVTGETACCRRYWITTPSGGRHRLVRRQDVERHFLSALKTAGACLVPLASHTLTPVLCRGWRNTVLLLVVMSTATPPATQSADGNQREKYGAIRGHLTGSTHVLVFRTTSMGTGRHKR
jgi:hypothetical protein